jgi:hypothetical protein
MATPPATYQVCAWYRQFYVLDPDSRGDTGSADFWTQEAFDLRLAVEQGVIGIGTVTNGEVPVTIETLDTEPALSLEPWDHVVEASLQLSRGRLELAPCPDYDRPAATIPLAPGWVRVRVHCAGLHIEPPSEVDYCGDSYLVQAWPSEPRERVLLKKFGSLPQR